MDIDRGPRAGEAAPAAGHRGLRHALGATYDGRQVGSFGDAAFFSTEEKTVSSGMGGVVVTNDPVLAERMEALQASCARPAAVLAARYLLKVIVFHLITEPSVHRHTRPLYKLLRSRIIAPGATSDQEARGERPARYEQRLSNAQAALALSQLRRLAANLAHREEIANRYTTRLDALGFDVPRPAAKARPAFARYPACVTDKATVMRAVVPYAVLGQWLSEPVDGAIPPGGEDYQPGSCPCGQEHGGASREPADPSEGPDTGCGENHRMRGRIDAVL